MCRSKLFMQLFLPHNGNSLLINSTNPEYTTGGEDVSGLQSWEYTFVTWLLPFSQFFPHLIRLLFILHLTFDKSKAKNLTTVPWCFRIRQSGKRICSQVSEWERYYREVGARDENSMSYTNTSTIAYHSISMFPTIILYQLLCWKLKVPRGTSSHAVIRVQSPKGELSTTCRYNKMLKTLLLKSNRVK